MFNNNSTQQEIAQEKPFIREVVRAYLVDDEHIRIWNDATVDLLDKDLNLLGREKKIIRQI